MWGDALLRSAVYRCSAQKNAAGACQKQEIYQADPEHKQQSCLGSRYCEVPGEGRKDTPSRKKTEQSEKWTLQNVLHSGSCRYGEPQYMAPKTGLSMQILKTGTMKRSVYLTNSLTGLIGNSSQQDDERCQVSKAKAMHGFTDHHPERKAEDTHGEGLGPGERFCFQHIFALLQTKERRWRRSVGSREGSQIQSSLLLPVGICNKRPCILGNQYLPGCQPETGTENKVSFEQTE